jgi:uncharacterized membrane protein
MRDGAIHPFHAAVLAGSVPLFLGAWLCDVAYGATYEIQWNNFASWLLVGALAVSGVALVLAAIDLGRRERRARGAVMYALVLLATWVVGLFDALMHARDAWASMPAGLWMSAAATLLAGLATLLGFRSLRSGAST